MPRKKSAPEFVKVPARPGLYVKFYHGSPARTCNHEPET